MMAQGIDGRTGPPALYDGISRENFKTLKLTLEDIPNLIKELSGKI